MHYDPRKDARPLSYDPFKSCTVPRPIGWISTISSDGKPNLAPFSQWQNITYDPPIVMFSADQHVDGRKKDTVINAQETGYFVWNMATYDLREAVNKLGANLKALPKPNIEKNMQGASQSVNGFSTAIKGLAGIVAGAFAFEKIIEFGKAVLIQPHNFKSLRQF